ncbi:DEKNAAC104890 [Brettanomyces naardenensis]|uniref:DEKNAAC104890 n=1 Tax=Brettanomyces naardenensis TaxID=13370 RepID=A0A448YS53_BRENA|nr:DEKNAAC104890 [Brettanomyces naardenensis]
MALLEYVQRKISRFGLVPRLVKSMPKISFLLALASILWLVVLPIEGQFRNTYISENALMPSQAYSFFRESEWNFLRGYRDEIYKHREDPLEERNSMLQDWMREIGYKTAILNYTNPQTGENRPTLYAIYHAPKGDDTEAIVLVAPWHTREGRFNIGGTGLGVSLAKYFHRLSIWAKNIIVVFPEDGQDTLRNWVNAYHTSLDQTGGSILSAIVMEYPSGADGIDYIELEYAGVNGQLPNLDILNTAALITDHEGMRISIHKTPRGQLWATDYSSRLTTLLHAIFDYATAGLLSPSRSGGGGSGCEAFSGWNVQALTLRAVGDGDHDITTYGRVVEAVFRSVNNLLEKFHQSYFFYLLLGPTFFVSIGNYLPASVLAAASFVVGSASSLLGNHNVNNAHMQFSPSLIVPSTSISPMVALLCFFTVLSASVLAGIRLADVTNNFPYDDLHKELYAQLTYRVCIIPSIVLSLWPTLSSYFFRLPKSKEINDVARFLNAFSLFCFAFTLIALLVFHFSLSLLISLVSLPLVFVRYGPSCDKNTRLRSTIFLISSCPFVWLFVLGIFNKTDFELDRVRNLIQYFQMNLLRKEIQSVIDWAELVDIKQLLEGPVDLLYSLISGYSRFQNWTWLFIVISWIPAWLCTLIVSCIDVECGDFEVDEEKKRR